MSITTRHNLLAAKETLEAILAEEAPDGRDLGFRASRARPKSSRKPRLFQNETWATRDVIRLLAELAEEKGNP